MADNQKYAQLQPFQLAGAGGAIGDTTLVIESFTQIDGTNLTITNFGNKGWGTLEPGSSTQEEQISFTGVVQNGNGTATLTGVKNVSFVDPYTETSGLSKSHAGGTTFVISNTSGFYSNFANKQNDETIDGVWDFTQVPNTQQDPVNGDDIARRSWVLSVVNGGPVTFDAVTVAGVAGETVSAGQLVYFDDTDNEWKLVDADTAATLNDVKLGIAQGAGTNGNLITNGVLIEGLDKTQTGLTPGSLYYASNTAGGISLTPGTTTRVVGIAYNTTSLYFDPNFTYIPTAIQKLAMVGNGGTLSSVNRYVTEVGGVNNLRTQITQETASGIVATNPVFMQSDGEASRTATVKEWVNMNKYDFIDGGSTASASNMNIVWMTENKFFVTFVQQNSTTFRFMASYGWIDNYGQIGLWDTIMIGNTTNTSTVTSYGVRLSNTKMIAAFCNAASGASYDVYILSVGANNAITVGTPVTVSTESSILAIDRLSDSSFIMAARDAGSDDCYVYAATVSGTTITVGSSTNFDTAASQNMSVVGLTSTKAIICWESGSVIHQRVANISGTTVTAGASTYNIVSVSSFNRMVKLADDKWIMAFNESTTVKVIVGTVSGDVITSGSSVSVEAYVDGGGISIGGMTIFGTNAVIVAYNIDNTQFIYGNKFAYVTVSGTTPTVVNTTLVSDRTAYINNTYGSSGNFNCINGYLVFSMDGGALPITRVINSFKPIFNEVYIGAALEAPDGSGLVRTAITGRSGAIFTGLTFGVRYLWNQDFTLSPTGVYPAGRAIGTTEMLLD